MKLGNVALFKHNFIVNCRDYYGLLKIDTYHFCVRILSFADYIIMVKQDSHGKPFYKDIFLRF